MSPRKTLSGGPARDAAPLFSALGDETRLGLLHRLCAHGPASIARLSDEVDVSRQAVSKHLEILAQVGLVQSEKHGRERIWSLEPTRLDDAHDYLEQISKLWDQALDRLRRFVED